MPGHFGIAGARHSLMAAVGLALCIPAAARAADADIEAFYRGKTVQMVVAFGAGGGYDLLARLLGRFMTKHIAGNPVFVTQNMPGAGGKVAGNWLYNIAARDGSVMGVVDQGAPLDQAMKISSVQFDAAQFNWIGNPSIDNLVTIVSASSGVRTLADLKKAGQLFCGDVGGGPTTTFPQVINKLLGTDNKIITGYPTVANAHLAMDRGEINCIGGTTWSALRSTRGQQLREGKFDILLQWGTEKDPDISAQAGHDVALSVELGANEADRQAVRFISSSSTIGRPFVMPPGVPRERVEAFRAAFDQTMKDPEFLAAAASSAFTIKPLSGPELQKLATEIAHAPADEVKRAAALLGADMP